MNRLVSLLLVALSLAAVGLAQPAHAQWTADKPYFVKSNDSNPDKNTVITAKDGVLTITATPDNTAVGHNTAGSYSGTVAVDFKWTGAPDAARTYLPFTETDQVAGLFIVNNPGSGFAASNAGRIQTLSTGHDGNPYKSGPTAFSGSTAGFLPSTTVISVTAQSPIGGIAGAYFPSSAASTATISLTTP